MAYNFYIDGLELPVAPSKMEIKTKSNNKVINLINEGDVNILKIPGLTEISFSFLVPQTAYPFAPLSSGASVYLGKLESLKTGRRPFQFIVTRMTPGGKMLFNTNMTVALEDYTIDEDSKNGMDLMITVKMKQYKAYSTRVIRLVVRYTKPTAVVVINRQTQSAPQKKTYTVKKGDCLWNIAKKYLGNGSRYTEIYELNKDKIKSNYIIYVGQVLTLP